jgi:hypothetical protein
MSNITNFTDTFTDEASDEGSVSSNPPVYESEIFVKPLSKKSSLQNNVQNFHTGSGEGENQDLIPSVLGDEVEVIKRLLDSRGSLNSLDDTRRLDFNDSSTYYQLTGQDRASIDTNSPNNQGSIVSNDELGDRYLGMHDSNSQKYTQGNRQNELQTSMTRRNGPKDLNSKSKTTTSSFADLVNQRKSAKLKKNTTKQSEKVEKPYTYSITGVSLLTLSERLMLKPPNTTLQPQSPQS